VKPHRTDAELCSRKATQYSAVLFLGIASLIVTSGRPAEAAPLFSAPFYAYPTGLEINEFSIAGADLNADGKEDIVVATTGKVSILLSDGDGVFRSPVDYAIATGGGQTHVALGDFDGNGTTDIAASVPGDLSVLLGNGDGTFKPEKRFSLGISVRSIAAADLNGDGRQDLVTAGASVSVLLSHGSGLFPTHTEYSGGAVSVAVADMDGDHQLDLIVATPNDSNTVTISVLAGNGDGTFRARSDYAAGSGDGFGIASVGTGDLNGDGARDVVVISSRGPGSALLGNGDGTLGPREDLSPPLRGHAIAIGDLNHDGRLDLVAGAPDGTFIELGKGDGTFGSRTVFPAGTSLFFDDRSVVVGDMSGDGIPDLALVNGVSKELCIALGNGDGSFGSRRNYGTRNPVSVAVGDLNGDGTPDLVAADIGNLAPPTGGVSVFLGDGDGSFAPEAPYETSLNPGAVLIGDLNADHMADVVAADENSAAVSVLLGNGTGTLGPRTDYASVLFQGKMAMGDFNGDGVPDIVILTRGQGDIGSSVLLGDGHGGFGPHTDSGIHGQDAAVADLNGDGKADLVLVGPLNFAHVLVTNASFLEYAIGDGFPDFSHSVAIGDLNHDGHLDLAVGNINTVSILLGQGDGTFAPRTDFPTGGGPQTVAVGPQTVVIADIDGDGNPDVVTGNAKDYSAYTVSVLPGNGDGTLGSPIDYGVDGPPQKMVVGDFNGDGRPDLAVACYTDVTVLLNTGNAGPREARAFVSGKRTIPVGSDTPGISVRIEPVSGSFDPSAVDLSTVTMSWNGSHIAATPSKQSRVGDADRNGVQDVSTYFAGSDLASLFSSVQGRREVSVGLEGRLITGGIFSAPLQLTIVGSVAGEADALVSPNPMNPRGVLRFRTAATGDVSVRLYDISGRLVRTIAHSGRLEAGDHQFAIDGQDDRGMPLSSGVYFYRIETRQGTSEGRLTVLK